MAQDPNYPFAYSKYNGQSIETKGRTNSNRQDLRHECQVYGGLSKCHICEQIICKGEGGVCNLQLQGLKSTDMSKNIPVVSDTSWAVGGKFRHDYAGSTTSHMCVMLTGGHCINPNTTDFTGCRTRCFGHGFPKPPIKDTAMGRSLVDTYPGMFKWPDDGQIDLFDYPKNCGELSKSQNVPCTYSGSYTKNPSFNPQGYVFTVAGTGRAGFHDGPVTAAQFNNPQDLAVDSFGNIFVADTKNHAIRKVDHSTKIVTTIAGKGPNSPGRLDGACNIATFSSPRGIDVTYLPINGVQTLILVVADTGNHRIRKITVAGSSCTVSCLSGLCGNNTLSEALTTFQAPPLSGYADGEHLETRFSSPQDVIIFHNHWVVVADTGNVLIRLVAITNGTTLTLAGNIVPGEKDRSGKPLAGCTPPCLRGNPGFRDGNLTSAQFYNPVVVSLGPNDTIWVVDEHRIRTIEMPSDMTTYYGIHSEARVSTIAGNSLTGHDDGLAQLSTFYYSSGLWVSEKGIAYVTDAASCHVRRITPYPLVGQSATCSSLITDFLRPSGCISYDPPLDRVGRKISRVEGNIQYNYEMPPVEPSQFPTRSPTRSPSNPPTQSPSSVTSKPTYQPFTLSPTAAAFAFDKDRGKYIKNCVGVPPHDRFDKHFVFQQGDNLVIDDHRVSIDEDSEKGMAILINCPSNCQLAGNKLEGNTWYSEYSSVCLSAIHDGKITSAGGLLLVIIERFDYLHQHGIDMAINGTNRNGLLSRNMTFSSPRVFKTERYNISDNMVHTIGGAPNAPLEEVCGSRDGQPATAAEFNYPGGISARPGVNITDSEYLYVADTNNHKIRAMSAVCTFICENGGRCVGDDHCLCPAGWTGVDCAIPVCSSACGKNKVCIAPNTCGCKPGYSGPNCNIALCQQTCRNNGTCSAPDTCSCQPGWFDMNCSTPVCSVTCGNGGNCTAPNKCACPKEWKGFDCRTPVCRQDCKNGGFCVAPDTCQCSPQWSNYDCSSPVCHQGFFEPFPSENGFFTVKKSKISLYKNCDLQSWCNATNEFECDQLNLKNDQLGVPFGPLYRFTTGRKVAPKGCTEIELPTHFKIPFELVRADNTTTGNLRYSPITVYNTDPRNSWRGYENATEGHAYPWVYHADRQVARVNFLNVTQGHYVCANGGSCVSPDICACAPGWIGFDCRTPVCDQGYYYRDQPEYVFGENSNDTAFEYKIFKPFLQNSTKLLQWPYSNPNYTYQVEAYVNESYVRRSYVTISKRGRYLGPATYDLAGHYTTGLQGGYRCSIRGWTEWENETFVFSHPNYYSQFMDKHRQTDNVTYTFWQGMHWPDTHRKSRILDYVNPAFFNRTFAYTNEGWRRRGIWNRTGNPWRHGICFIEFHRNCSGNPKKAYDLLTHTFGLFTLDTDISYRPIIAFNDFRVNSFGRWKEAGGQCVDEVLRGCANNGTCVAPNKCHCAKGWQGADCKTPRCEQTCNHHGNCTAPNICTCEKGWSGFDCSIPLCAQECQNGGQCVAPDTCQCFQFDTAFYDGRIAGGRPKFQDPAGNPLKTGWTGYDCSVPICVQAEKFVLNVPNAKANGYQEFGGHGASGLLKCTDEDTGLTLPRCPQYNYPLSMNDGTSWQTGCGYDPFDTGCCNYLSDNRIECFRCPPNLIVAENKTYYCAGSFDRHVKQRTEKSYFKLYDFLDENNNYKICGGLLAPRFYEITTPVRDYGESQFYIDLLNADQSNYNFRSNLTSNRFLCHVTKWEQGDYHDDAKLGDIVGAGSYFGLEKRGRAIRINTPNILKDEVHQSFVYGDRVYGEGIYVCFNGGTCLSPDTCTCQDGYTGYDCNTPLCRHLQPSGKVTSCVNGGICSKKDRCDCIQTDSVLWTVHPEASKAKTGWTGSDCSMPMCSQGYYDPFCTDLPQAPGGEGCYRCANSGNCTAPDVCTCAPGWSGYDCKTPVCEAIADPLTRTQLDTYYEDKVIGFESDPCGMRSIYGMHGWHGTKYAHGNCTQPNQCTCLCKIPYSEKQCKKAGALCSGPWQDPMVKGRNLLKGRGPHYTFGTTNCFYGYEGNVDDLDRFTTCHQTIYMPTSRDRNSVSITVGCVIAGFALLLGYYFIGARLRKRFLLAKIERRKTKRSSEDSLSHSGSTSFVAGNSFVSGRSSK
jgi:hypothetical protein